VGSGYRYECDNCGHTVETSGPWEFYRDATGARKPFGHPVPISEEAVRMGIAGLSAELYCPLCDKVHDLVAVEFKRPYQGRWFWLEAGEVEPKDEFKREDAVKCPDCGNSELILGPEDEDSPGFNARMSILCPRCKKGKLSGGMAWIS